MTEARRCLRRFAASCFPQGPAMTGAQYATDGAPDIDLQGWTQLVRTVAARASCATTPFRSRRHRRHQRGYHERGHPDSTADRSTAGQAAR
jgi:hypothetical protein